MPEPKKPVGSEIPEDETPDQAVKRLSKSVDNLTAIGKRQQKIIEMSPEDIVVYKSLETEEDQNSFVDMSEDDRKAFVDKQKEADVSVTLADGTVVKKADLGEKAFDAIVKQQGAIEKNQKQIEKQQRDMELVTLEKRANEEFSSIPAVSAKELAGLLYDSSNLTKDSRDVLGKVLKSANEIISNAEMFNTDFELGTSQIDKAESNPAMEATEKALEEQHPEMVAKDKQ